jgi:prepilin-type processing-associated H-X9-DG protein
MTVDVEEWGWAVFLLPYMQRKPLYNELNPNERRLADVLLDPFLVRMIQTPLAEFRCPSDRTASLLPRNSRPFYAPGSGNAFEPPTSNYIGVCGLFDRADGLENNGVLYGNSSVSIRDVSDGVTYTFHVGERDKRCAAGTWCGNRNPFGLSDLGAYFVQGRVSIKLNDPLDTGADSCREGFSSPHSGIGNFLFCDGAVRPIADNIGFSNGTVDVFALTGTFTRTQGYQLGVYQLLGIRDDDIPFMEEWE